MKVVGLLCPQKSSSGVHVPARCAQDALSSFQVSSSSPVVPPPSAPLALFSATLSSLLTPPVSAPSGRRVLPGPCPRHSVQGLFQVWSGCGSPLHTARLPFPAVRCSPPVGCLVHLQLVVRLPWLPQIPGSPASSPRRLHFANADINTNVPRTLFKCILTSAHLSPSHLVRPASRVPRGWKLPGSPRNHELILAA